MDAAGYRGQAAVAGRWFDQMRCRMRKASVWMGVLVVLILGLAVSAPLLLRSARGQAGAGGVAAAGEAGDDMPHRTAKAFAPFIHAVVTRRVTQAQRIFKMRRSVETAIEQADTVRIFGRFTKPDGLDLNLIGGRTLGQNIGILLFTVATEDGPVAFKISYYAYGTDMYVARMEVVDNWDDVERLAATVDMLPAPVTVPLGSDPVGAGGG